MAMAQTILQAKIDENTNLIASETKVIKQYCRLCLSCDETEFKQLFSPFSTTQSIVEVVEDFAKVIILEGDQHSKLICFQCFGKLTESENFRFLIENSDFTLRTQFTKCEELIETGNNSINEAEDSDHEKIDLDEIDLKQEIINRGIQLVDNDYNSILSKELTGNEFNNDLNEIQSLNVASLGIDSKECDKKPDRVRQNGTDTLCKTEIKDWEEVKKNRTRKNYELKCPDCGKVFRRQVAFKKHLSSHSGVYPHHCSVCNKGFIVKFELNVHETKHTEERQYQCEECGKRFKTLDYLKNHRRAHGDDRPFKCDRCNKKYKAKQLLMLHKSSHVPIEDKSNFVCEICHKNYPTELLLHNHVLRIHKERKLITCEICGKTVSNYSFHRKVHTKPYKCNVCNQGFGNSTTLKEHLTVHSGEKLYECDVCNKSFGFKGSLHTHKKIHDVIKRFKCKLCEKQFTCKHHLKKHLKQVHQKEND